MLLLCLGIAVFVGIHVLPAMTSARSNLIMKFGDGPYKAVFSTIALVGLVMIIIGKARADFVHLWQPPEWGRLFAIVVMIPVFVLLAAAHMPTNIKRVTPHPMLWGVTLWSVAHLMANGDLASLILFGSLGAFATFDMVSANHRGAVVSDKHYPVGKDLVVVVSGSVVYAVFLYMHAILFGVPAVS